MAGRNGYGIDPAVKAAREQARLEAEARAARVQQAEMNGEIPNFEDLPFLRRCREGGILYTIWKILTNEKSFRKWVNGMTKSGKPSYNILNRVIHFSLGFTVIALFLSFAIYAIPLGFQLFIVLLGLTIWHDLRIRRRFPPVLGLIISLLGIVWGIVLLIVQPSEKTLKSAATQATEELQVQRDSANIARYVSDNLKYHGCVTAEELSTLYFYSNGPEDANGDTAAIVQHAIEVQLAQGIIRPCLAGVGYELAGRPAEEARSNPLNIDESEASMIRAIENTYWLPMIVSGGLFTESKDKCYSVDELAHPLAGEVIYEYIYKAVHDMRLKGLFSLCGKNRYQLSKQYEAKHLVGDDGRIYEKSAAAQTQEENQANDSVTDHENEMAPVQNKKHIPKDKETCEKLVLAMAVDAYNGGYCLFDQALSKMSANVWHDPEFWKVCLQDLRNSGKLVSCDENGYTVSGLE